MNKAKHKIYQVPLDILTDILRIILEGKIENKITGQNENKSQLELTLFHDGLENENKTLENIEAILKEYHHYRFEEEEQEDWREQ